MTVSTRLSQIWSDMKRRCENPNCNSYSRYGARGITVCEEWHDSKKFYEWALSHGYAENLTIDRIDNNLGYSPKNCRWATAKEQVNNRRCNYKVSAFGRNLTSQQWADLVGMDRKTLRLRIASGMTPEEALTKPLMKNGHVYKQLKEIVWKEEDMPICDLTKKSKAKRLESNFKRYFLGYKQSSGRTWNELAEACDETRQTLQNRFNNDLLNLWEWKILMAEVGMPSTELVEVMKL